MSDEQNSEEVKVLEPQEPEDLSAKITDADDNLVRGNLQVSVLPTEVALQITLTPAAKGVRISNVSANFVSMKDGMVEHSFVGSTQALLREATEGQGYSCDLGTDTMVFDGHSKKELYALVAGAVTDADGNPHNYMFTQQFHLD